MNKEEFLDRLDRVHLMEEQMTEMLIDLCQPVELPSDLPVEIRKRIEGLLASIRADTLRHKEIVLKIKEASK